MRFRTNRPTDPMAQCHNVGWVLPTTDLTILRAWDQTVSTLIGPTFR
jgi:hypothetical protein